MSEKKVANICLYIKRIYTKYISCTVSNVPQVFEKAWLPDIQLSIKVESKELTGNLYEVTLHTQTNVILQKEKIFSSTVQLSGIFSIQGINSTAQMQRLFNVYCPDVLFPYSRECIANLTLRSGLPSLNLAPVNFDALFKNNERLHRDKK